MNTNENTNTNVDAREEVIELGIASVETHGTPLGEGEFLGHDIALGIASEETQGIPVGSDEFLGMNASGISNH